MKRVKSRPEKIRVNIYIEKEIYEKSGDYILNLSAFINKTLKNYLDLQEQKLLIGSDKNSLCKKIPQVPIKKEPIDTEQIDPSYKWWE